MGEAASRLKLPECHRPTVLPLKGESAEHENCSENTEKTAVGSAMKTGQQWGLTGGAAGGQRTLNDLKGSGSCRPMRGLRRGFGNRDHS